MSGNEADDDVLRAAVHDAVADVSASSLLVDRVRAGVARRRKRVIVTRSLATAVIAGAAVVGPIYAFHGRSSSEPPADQTPLACPTAPERPSPNGQRRGTDQHLVPGSPVEALACDYLSVRGTNSNAATTSLVRSDALAGSRMTAVVAALNSPFTVGEPDCPFFARQNILLVIFRYPTGADVKVLVPVSGCPVVSNGPRAGWFVSGLPPTVGALAGPDR